MDYSKEILEELKKMNSMLSKLLSKYEPASETSDFDQKVKMIKDRMNSRFPKVTNNK